MSKSHIQLSSQDAQYVNKIQSPKEEPKIEEDILSQQLTMHKYRKRLTKFTQTTDVLCNAVHTFPWVLQNKSI